MISFRSRNSVIRKADLINRKANSVYPSISEYRTSFFIENNSSILSNRRYLDYKLKTTNKIEQLRNRADSGLELFKNIIDTLKLNKIGNCYEKSRLAEIIGKINGFNNIKSANIYFTRNKSGAVMKLDHVVALVTDNELKEKLLYSFKRKETVIIDPLLGITDFAENYFLRLKNEFNSMFSYIPNSDFWEKKVASETKNLNEFKELKKIKCFKPKFFVKLHDDESLSAEKTEVLKNDFPELII